MRIYTNPILPGSNSDPTICRVGEDYYLATSTFAYFPGIPIYHSRDLVHWRHISNVLTRPSQLDLGEIKDNNRGIWAPTLRYHDGLFYVIVTVNTGRHAEGPRKYPLFYVTAEDPVADWSEPHFLETSISHDPDIFFENGRAYVVACGTDAGKNGVGVYAYELDLEAHRFVDGPYFLWAGAERSIEGPHIYKHAGRYYLFTAQGGGGYPHNVSVARCDSLLGSYEDCPWNPVFSNRHLGWQHPIWGIGHADIVDTQNDEWWLVCLGSRLHAGTSTNMGRETFMAPMTWEESRHGYGVWPTVSPGTGRMEESYPVPDLPSHPWPDQDPGLRFRAGSALPPDWVGIGVPPTPPYDLEERPGFCRLRLLPHATDDAGKPLSALLRRQTDLAFTLSARMEFTAQTANEEAGLMMIACHNTIRCTRTVREGKSVVQLVARPLAGDERVLAVQEVSGTSLGIKAEVDGPTHHYAVREGDDAWRDLAREVDGSILGREAAKSYTGAHVGVYATSHGEATSNHADFESIEYRT